MNKTALFFLRPFLAFMLVIAPNLLGAHTYSDDFDSAVVALQHQANVDPIKALDGAYHLKQAALLIRPPAKRTIALAQSARLIGIALIALNRSRDAIVVLQEALGGGIMKVAPRTKLAGDLNMALANAMHESLLIEPALAHLQTAYSIYDQAKEQRGKSLALQNIGSIYFVARDFSNALRYYDEAQAVYQADPILQFALANNRGNIYKEQGDAAAAEREFRKALVLAQMARSPAMEGRVLGNLAGAQLAAGKLSEANAIIRRRFELGRQLASRDWEVDTYGVAAQASFQQGDKNRAAKLIDTALRKAGNRDAQMLSRELEHTAYEIFKSRNDQFKALLHLERFKQLDDQARAIAASANAALMSARFDFAKQNAQIAQLRQTEAEKEATIQRNRVIFQRRLLAGAAFVMVLLLVGVVSIRRSRDEVRAANDELTDTNAELQSALAARTEFLATTSHEIRTPLNGILGMTQVLLADRALDPGVKERIELVDTSGRTMKALVDDLLDVAKLSNGELVIHRAEMELRQLLQEAAQMWEAQAFAKNVTIVRDIAGAPERIVEDEVRLRQIVFNLLANAVKFTDRGTVRLRAEFVAFESLPGIEPTAGTLRIAVVDTGIGIPADRLDEIFESFRQIDGGTTRRHGGTGLGLAICRNLARAMGGDVRAESVLGGGSTFTLELPCTIVSRPALRAAPVSLDETRLLLLESNPLSRSIFAAVLAPHVGRIVPAGDAEEVPGLIEKERIDLVMADAGAFASDFEGAIAFAATVARSGARLVLLWTAPDERQRRAATDAGILRIIAKPLPAQEVVAALKDIYMTVDSRQEIAA